VPDHVGAVLAVHGEATVTQANGTIQTLIVNTELLPGDSITSPANGFVVVRIGSDEITLSNGETYTVKTGAGDSLEAQEQIMAAIEEAQTPSEPFDPNALEPSAAGVINDPFSMAPMVNQLAEAETPIAREAFSSEADAAENQSLSVRNESAPGSNGPAEQTSLLGGTPAVESGQTVTLSPISLSEDSLAAYSSPSALKNVNATSFETENGTVSIAENGTWTYELNNSSERIQSLGAGDTISELISLPGSQSNSYNVLVTINGSNDRATITGENASNVTEDGTTLSGTGALNIMDIDQGEERFRVVNNQETLFGNASVDAQGQWHYQLDNELEAVQSLRAGDVITDNFAVTSLDGTREIVRITIEGSNDRPIFTGQHNLGELYTADTITTGDTLQMTDADFGESGFIAQEDLVSKYGSASISESGTWSYELDASNASVQGLSEGQTLYDLFAVSTLDGTQQNIIIEINGGSAQSAAAAAHFDDQDLVLAQLGQGDNDVDASQLYIWQPSTDSAELELIPDFDGAAGGDTLLISDLLLSEAQNDTIHDFLSIEQTSTGALLHIDAQGDGQQPTQDVLLGGFDTSTLGASSHEILAKMMQNGTLEIAGL